MGIFLNGNLLKCRTQKAQVVVDLTECQERLAAKLEEINAWQQKNAKLQREFDQIVAKSNPFYAALRKIFCRKIKRAAASKECESERESSSDNLSSSEESDDAQSDDANADDLCPRDCDNLIFEKVMELREKRLDEEEILNEFEALVNELRQANATLILTEKKIDKNLTETEREIEKFQTEKQHFLNKMVIFENSNLLRLQHRIGEQNEQKIKSKKDYIELKKFYKLLTKKIKTKELKIENEKRKCEQVQFLKYGRLVSLEVLDANTNCGSEQSAAIEKLEQIKKKYKQKFNEIDVACKQSKEKLKDDIMKNTANIEKMTDLKTKRAALCNELSSILDITVIADSAPSDQKRNRELQKFVEKAKTQANEIDVLKAEIHLLQRKGGMLYAVPEI